jgi:hypothetical protein
MAADGRIETPAQQYQRVLEDLQRSRAIMEKELGHAPRALVWPFGRYNANGDLAAQAAGFRFALTLQPTLASLDNPLHIARFWPSHNPTLADLVATITTPPRPASVQRLVCVNPDRLWNADPAVFDAQLGHAIERIRVLGATTAVVQALDVPGDANQALNAWFPAPGLPMRANALSRIAWQLRTRACVQVVARMPYGELASAGLNPTQIESVFTSVGAQLPWDGLLLEGCDSVAARSAFAAAQSSSPELRRIWLAPAKADAGQLTDNPELVLYSPAQMGSLLARQGALSSAQAARIGLWMEDAKAPSAQTLGAATRDFQLHGGTAIGWCPDEAVLDQPNAAQAAPDVSAATFPGRF